MLSFNQTLAYTLGFSAKQFDPRFAAQPITFPLYTADDQAFLQVILDKLTAIDSELEINRKDSMALDVGGVKVDFLKNIQITKAEGTRLLRSLEQASGIPMKFDKYLGRSPNGMSSTPLVVRCYS